MESGVLFIAYENVCWTGWNGILIWRKLQTGDNGSLI